MITYFDVRSANRDAFRSAQRSIWSLGLPCWGKFNKLASIKRMDPETLYAEIHKGVTKAVAERGQIRWAHPAFGFTSEEMAQTRYPEQLCRGPSGELITVELIVAVVIALLFPGVAETLLLVGGLYELISTVLKYFQEGAVSGQFGFSPAEHAAQIARWAAQAEQVTA